MAYDVDPVLVHLLDDLVALAPFGFSTEVSLMVNGSLVRGTPIADAAYFASLGEHFRKAIGSVGDRIWGGDYKVRDEQQRGWSENQLLRMGDDRERAYRRFGEQLQEQVRQRVRSRPQGLPYSLADESARQEEYEQISQFFGDAIEPVRKYLHLRDVTTYGQAAEVIHHPIWRLRLRDVSGWWIESSSPAQETT